LKNRIDSSDQDENASYEELNEDDLKTHSSGEQVNAASANGNAYNNIQGGNENMNIAAHKSFGNVNPNMKPAIAEEDEDDNYSDQYEDVDRTGLNDMSQGQVKQ